MKAIEGTLEAILTGNTRARKGLFFVFPFSAGAENWERGSLKTKDRRARERNLGPGFLLWEFGNGRPVFLRSEARRLENSCKSKPELCGGNQRPCSTSNLMTGKILLFIMLRNFSFHEECDCLGPWWTAPFYFDYPFLPWLLSKYSVNIGSTNFCYLLAQVLLLTVVPVR